jgi:hypothetical protein
MPANVAAPPVSSSSPSNGVGNGNTITIPLPNYGAVPTSPSPKARGRSAAAATGDLSGPASPGRVRRVGGLREVRERIRKELGDW